MSFPEARPSKIKVGQAFDLLKENRGDHLKLNATLLRVASMNPTGLSSNNFKKGFDEVAKYSIVLKGAVGCINF